MVTRTSPFRVPFPRRVLLRIHDDLFQIERFALSQDRIEYDLTDVEILILIGEDRRFFRHNGIDCRSLLREISRAATFRRHGGASTIDMQFVRMATGYYERTMQRKLYEMLLAWLIQFKYTKIQILRSYLKQAYFGAGLYGIESASEALYGKHPNSLAIDEGAVIASMLVYPRPKTQSAKWKARVDRRSAYLASLFGRLEKRFKKLPSWEAV